MTPLRQGFAVQACGKHNLGFVVGHGVTEVLSFVICGISFLSCSILYFENFIYLGLKNICHLAPPTDEKFYKKIPQMGDYFYFFSEKSASTVPSSDFLSSEPADAACSA